MQHLQKLWSLANTLGALRDLTQQHQIYRFPVPLAPPVTFYLQAEAADVYFTRWDKPLLEVSVRLQHPYGWRIASDQDDAGVYFVAQRRAVVGTLSSALFEVFMPSETYLTLRLSDVQLRLANVSGTLDIAPPAHESAPPALPPAPDAPKLGSG
jgi:hypothetical protein